MNYIGIDPDVTKSGVVFYNSKHKNLIIYENMTFFELFDYLSATKFTKNINIENEKVKVIIEAGWLNKGNWHKVNKGTSSINAQIGQRTGANHEVGKKIVEMCEYLKIDYELIKPTKTKLNAIIFNKITGYSKRTNQEQRDASMLVFGRN